MREREKAPERRPRCIYGDPPPPTTPIERKGLFFIRPICIVVAGSENHSGREIVIRVMNRSNVQNEIGKSFLERGDDPLLYHNIGIYRNIVTACNGKRAVYYNNIHLIFASFVWTRSRRDNDVALKIETTKRGQNETYCIDPTILKFFFFTTYIRENRSGNCRYTITYVQRFKICNPRTRRAYMHVGRRVYQTVESRNTTRKRDQIQNRKTEKEHYFECTRCSVHYMRSVFT